MLRTITKRTALVSVFLAVCVLCSTSFAYGSERMGTDDEVSRRILLALQYRESLHGDTKAKTCDCGGDAGRCTCGTDCSCPFCAASMKAASPIDYALYLLAYNRAIRQNKPLLIWVGETCPSCENKWTQYVHARLAEYDGVNGVEAGPEVIIANPDHLGGMTIAGRFQGIPSLNQVAALAEGNAVTRGISAPSRTTPPVPLLTCCSPVMAFQPMMGGFGGGMPMGGGFRGGFGGGGSCRGGG